MWSMGDIVGLILVYSYVTVVIIVSTLAKKRFPGCGYRKIIHILVGNIAFLWWVFDSRYIMAFLAAAPFIVLLLLVTPRSPLRKLDNSFLKMATPKGTATVWSTTPYPGPSWRCCCSMTAWWLA